MEIKRSKCWYDSACTVKHDNCADSCIRYKEMSFLVDNSNIPINRQYPETLYAPICDEEQFIKLSKIKSNIVDFVNAGNNLYITSSTTGNGKTTWAIKLLLKYFNDIWPGNGFKARGLFIHVPTFLLKCKDFDTKDQQFDLLKKLIPDVDLVVWDDIAGLNMSSYDYSQLLMYIDMRSTNNKSNIYTGNIVDKDLLGKAVGSKILSRLWSNSTEVIVFKGGDKR